MNFGEIVSRVASKYGTTPEIVYAQMQSAIEEALLCASAEAAKEWAKIPIQTNRPTPEEVLQYLVEMLTPWHGPMQ